ncbi:MAG: GTP-binding protein [Clostridia bacterium]|nr:GTP-binding protein [Clostridia bacterium]
MTKIDIFSGFLGAGKTTLIKKLIKEAYAGEKLVLIENEFGEIGIDGGFLQDSGIEITEMNSGCICCSLVGDFGEALKKVLKEFKPDRILIEPSGVGKLSDVIRAVRNIDDKNVSLNSFTTVADVNKCKMYIKNFGEFFCDQIENALCIVLSRTGSASEDKIEKAVELLRSHNPDATIITTDWDKLSGAQLLAAMEKKNSLENELQSLSEEVHEHHHEHEHDEHCSCGCHDHEHHHEHHDHDHKHEHHHHEHVHSEDCNCGCHDHEHHHHHHADDVFSSWGIETAKKFTEEEIRSVLDEFDEGKCGIVLRAKGILEGKDGRWIHFDYVPGESDVRTGSADIIGRLCVIGSKLDTDSIAAKFGV